MMYIMGKALITRQFFCSIEKKPYIALNKPRFMQLSDLTANPFLFIVGFFTSVIVSYVTIYSLNERYQFAKDRPKNFKSFKFFWAVFSFVGTFTIILCIGNLFVNEQNLYALRLLTPTTLRKSFPHFSLYIKQYPVFFNYYIYF